ncbi:FAD/NAD(P)-binding protein [Bradyrhizobium sp. HKCCYLR20261]|uniref:FAD/NAD(P)-binding protein n=1 Tax=Bradyrhizobium sp. HKCCYLR20261 TaxID=3420760 RepID=UPI003EC01FEB
MIQPMLNMSETADRWSVTPERIAIIGTGPRGISVIERLAGRLAERSTLRSLVVYAIDSVEVGCGRLWRTDQPDWLLMNTRCKNVTMFPNPPDGAAWRAGYGPTFMEWWRQIDVNYPGPSGLAPRGLYGKYLKFVLDVVELNMPEQMHIERVQDRVTDIAEHAGEYVLSFESGRDSLRVDRLVICSGYPVSKAKSARQGSTASSRHLTSFDVLETFQSGLSLPADLSGQTIGLRGLGLSFYDVLSELTLGRGGRFAHGNDGDIRYVRSGREPRLIVAGSRSGFPLPMRGRNDRPAGVGFAPRFFTETRIAKIRAEGPACFRTSYLPWLTAEVNLAYVEKTLGPDRFDSFSKQLDACDVSTATIMPLMSELARSFGVEGLLDLEAIAAPFKGMSFPSQDAFRRAVVALVRQDVARSEAGEFTDPVKAGLDVLRFIRPLIRKAVDLGGLTPTSHCEFITSIGPTIAFLSTGPSLTRARQLLALIESGLVELLGPGASFRETDVAGFIASSNAVENYSAVVDVLIDAYVPVPNVDVDDNPAIRRLADAGLLRSFMGSGGVQVTAKPFHPVTRDGEVKDRIHVLGIPTEAARWFLHVGVIEPGVWDEFIDDADAIATVAIEKLVPSNPGLDERGSENAGGGARRSPNKYLV